jgi:hypothetical protein
MNMWDDLPNAQHIDWVLASVKQYPDIWAAARNAAYNAARNAALDVARNATRNATRNAALDAAYNVTRNEAGSAILALIAYDDCAHLLNMSSEQLKIWARLSEHPAAMLLQPAVIVRERISELEQA